MRRASILKTAAVAAKASLLGLALAGGLAGGPALALPTHQIEWEWYSDATYTEQVGGRVITCSGNGGRWGVKTAYAVYIQGDPCEIDPPNPGWNDPPVEWGG